MFTIEKSEGVNPLLLQSSVPRLGALLEYTFSPALSTVIIIHLCTTNSDALQANLIKGGYGVYVDQGTIIVQKDSNAEPLIDVKGIGIILSGALKYNIENALASCAAAIGLGIDYKAIRQGLMSFYCNQNPGRFNMYCVNDQRVILDYGQNKEGYHCVLDADRTP